jgi:hypothetical protein
VDHRSISKSNIYDFYKKCQAKCITRWGKFFLAIIQKQDSYLRVTVIFSLKMKIFWYLNDTNKHMHRLGSN